jgi:uncharacterized protein (TIGR02145 family)
LKTLKLLSLLVCISVSSLDAQTMMNIHQSNGTVLQIPLNTIDSITYTIDNPGNLATLSTLPIGNTTGTSATSGGNITNDGGTNITQRGVVWGTSQNPTTANNLTTNGSGTGSFTSSLSGLTANTTYYVRAYATNSAGTAYGNELNFTTSVGGGGSILNPNLTYGSLTDQEGNSYATIVVGTQEWMAENLRTTVYANGDPILNVTDSVVWLNQLEGAWCYYNNDSQNENPYGKLYNGYAVTDARNACPQGWHVPSDADWNTLINTIDPNADGGINTINIAGGKMKSSGLQYWNTPNLGATNESGFSALPGGLRNGISLNFVYKGRYCFFWSSTEFSPDKLWKRILDKSDSNIIRDEPGHKRDGYSVRCVRD